MLNYTKWFTNNYKKSEDFKLNYNELLNSSYLTPQNLKDFNNSSYTLTKLDIFKYVTVIEYLFKNNDHSLAYNLNPYLIDKNNKECKLFPYNEILETNQYKNIIIDLYFLDIPNHVYKLIPLSVLLGETENTTYELSETVLGEDLNEINTIDFNFKYFGKKSMSIFFMLYYEAFYQNITLYSYNDEYLPLSQILNRYSKDKLTEYSENTRYSTFSSNKIKTYSSVITKWDDLDSKGLDLLTKILTDIISDSAVKLLHFECKDSVSPVDFQELSKCYLSDYCLLYFLEIPENYDQVDEGVPMDLSFLIESNLNSKFLSSLILNNTKKID